MKNINELIFRVNNNLRTDLNVEKDDIKKLLAIAMKMEKQFAISGVSHSYYQVVHDTRKLGMQEVTDRLPDLESAKKALEHNKQWLNGMYIIAKINCG